MPTNTNDEHHQEENRRGGTVLWILLALVILASGWIIKLRYQDDLTTSQTVMALVCVLYSVFIYLMGSAAKSFGGGGLLTPPEFVSFFFTFPFSLIGLIM